MAGWIETLAHKYYGEPIITRGLTMEGWEEYDNRILAQYGKIGYFFLRRAQSKWDNLVWSIRPFWNVKDLAARVSRVVRRKRYNRNVIDTGLKGWADYDAIMQAVVFQCLVEYVEVELANMQLFGFSEKYKEYGFKWYHRYRLNEIRCPQAGLDYLDWEINKCEHPPQVEAARVIKELYLWWTKDRKERIDPFEASGLGQFFDDLPYGKTFRSRYYTMSKRKKEDPEYTKAYKEAQDRCSTLERQYAEEDEARLLQLIKVRRHMWT